MRLSELQRLRAVDEGGGELAHVKDVRLERQGRYWVVTHVVVGRAAVAERLGFLHGEVERPALLARIMRRVARHARVVTWQDVTLEDDRIIVSSTHDRPDGLEAQG